MAPQQHCHQFVGTVRARAPRFVGITWLALLILFGRFYSCSHFTDEDSKASRGCMVTWLVTNTSRIRHPPDSSLVSSRPLLRPLTRDSRDSTSSDRWHISVPLPLLAHERTDAHHPHPAALESSTSLPTPGPNGGQTPAIPGRVALQMSAIRRQSRAVSGNTVLWRLPQEVCREYQPHVTSARGARQATAMPPGSAPAPPPTAFKKRLAEEQRVGGLDDRLILAWLVRVIPGQTLIKLLMVLALNPQSSRQKKNDLRARPTRNLQTGLRRLWPSPPSPHAICPCRRGASGSVMPWETGLGGRGAGSSIWGHTAVPSPTSLFPRVPIAKYPELPGLKDTKLCCHSSRVHRFKIEVWAGRKPLQQPLKAPGDGPPRLPSFWG